VGRKYQVRGHAKVVGKDTIEFVGYDFLLGYSIGLLSTVYSQT